MSNSFRILMLSGFLLVTILGSSNAHAFLFILDGTSRNVQCLDVRDGSTANGTPVFPIPCNATFAQEWNWDFLQIRGIGNVQGVNKCLDVVGGGTAFGTPVQLFDCNGTGAQQWIYLNGQINNQRSGKCLTGVVFPNNPSPTQAFIGTCLRFFDRNFRTQQWLIR